MAIPFMGSKDPVAKAEADSAKADAKQAKQIANFERKTTKLQARWESSAKLRGLRNEFRQKHPGMQTTRIGWCWARMKDFGRLLDNVSPSTFVTVADRGVLAALFALYIVCYALDLFFFGTKAPEWYLVIVFIMLGFVLRTTAIAAGVMLESLRGKKEQKGARRTWTAIWLGCVLACMISAVSFFVGGYEKKGAQETAVTTVADTTATNVDAQIAALNKQAEDIRADLAVRIAPLNAEIERLDKDGKINEELANTQKARRKELEDNADAKIDAIDKTKLSLVANRGQAAQTAASQLAETNVSQSSTWAVFSWFSGRTGAHERDVVDVGMLFFAILIECMAAFGTSATYALRRWFKNIARRMAAEEREDAAQLDLELAQTEQRIALSTAAAAAARTQEMDDDEAVLKQAQALVEDAKRQKALAEAEAEAKRIREEIEAIKNGTAPLTKKQQDGQNGGLASDLINKTKGQTIKIPVGAWSGRPDRQPEEIAAVSLSVGIDYGTNNSAIACDNGGGAQIIPWADKGRTGPSVVYLPPNADERYVGRRAITEGKENPDFLFRHAKRFFAVPANGEEVGHQFTKGPDGDIWYRGPDRLYSPAEIAFCVLDEMLECAEFRLQHRPESVVLTHPAAFGDAQKKCLLEAARMANLKTVRLLAEPSAAAFAYKFHLGNIRHYFIYDWGGGTFDAAIPLGGKSACDTKFFDGIQVGGIDVDEAIVDWLKEGYRAEYGVDLGEDGNALDRLRAAAESAKIALSTRDSFKIEIPLIQTLPARTLLATLTVEKLEEIAKPFIDKTLALCESLLEQSGLTRGNIAEVILVGGMTNIPAVARAVEAFFGKKPRNDIDPDEAVALGAATFAAMFLDKSTKPAKIIERAPHDFGFETSKGVFHKVITKGTVYPLKEAVQVTITSEADNQDELSLHILEGDGFRAGETRRLAVHDFKGIAPAVAGEPSVDLIFNIDANGKRTVSGPDGLIFEGIGNV